VKAITARLKLVGQPNNNRESVDEMVGARGKATKAKLEPFRSD